MLGDTAFYYESKAVFNIRDYDIHVMELRISP